MRLIVGAVTDYSPYYPPRIGLAVNWYAANPGFHPIPAGYGLPWGTAEEEYIPADSLVFEAEFALAQASSWPRKRPSIRRPMAVAIGAVSCRAKPSAGEAVPGAAFARKIARRSRRSASPADRVLPDGTIVMTRYRRSPAAGRKWRSALCRQNWPDPRGFVPPPPAPERPPLEPLLRAR